MRGQSRSPAPFERRTESRQSLWRAYEPHRRALAVTDYFHRSEAMDGSRHNRSWWSEKQIASSLATNVRPMVGAPSTRIST